MGDIGFVIDHMVAESRTAGSDAPYQRLDPTSIGVMGHSLGGSAAVMALESPFMYDVTGVTATEFTFTRDPYPLPVPNVYSDTSWSHLGEWPQYAENNRLLTDPGPTASTVHIRGSGHLGLTDLAIVSPLLTRLLNGQASTADPRHTLEIIEKVGLQCGWHERGGAWPASRRCGRLGHERSCRSPVRTGLMALPSGAAAPHDRPCDHHFELRSHHARCSAGAGITTVLPIVEHIAWTQPERKVIIVHADRTAPHRTMRCVTPSCTSGARSTTSRCRSCARPDPPCWDGVCRPRRSAKRCSDPICGRRRGRMTVDRVAVTCAETEGVVQRIERRRRAGRDTARSRPYAGLQAWRSAGATATPRCAESTPRGTGLAGRLDCGTRLQSSAGS